MKFKDFYKEEITNSLLEDVKSYLLELNRNESWKEFIDGQSIGDCQGIVSDIIRKFPQFEKSFGEIEVDEYYVDEDGDEQNLMTHHWVEIDGKILEFSKGTLKKHINFDDLYSIDPENVERYHGF